MIKCLWSEAEQTLCPCENGAGGLVGWLYCKVVAETPFLAAQISKMMSDTILKFHLKFKPFIEAA